MWKFVPNTQNTVIITSTGRVFRRKPILPRYPERGRGPFVEIQPSLNRAGYLQIGIGQRAWPVHRLVALLFVDNPEEHLEVDHIDGNKINNNADNLQWVDHKTNCRNQITRKKCARPNFRWVDIVATRGDEVYHYSDLNDAYLRFVLPRNLGKGSRPFINAALRDGTRAYGFYWTGRKETR